MRELTLKIKNFGSINNAKLNIGKINIISGINGSGKTTGSKILYSFLVSLTQEGIDFHNKKIISYLDNVLSYLRFNPEHNNLFDIDLLELENKIKTNDFSFNDFKYILKELKNNEDMKNSKNFHSSINDLESNIILAEDINKRRSLIFKEILINEFNQDIIHTKPTKLYLQNGNGGFFVNFPLTESNINYRKINFPIFDVFYIETPFIFDFVHEFDFDNNVFLGVFLFHQLSLMKKLAATERNHGENYFDSQNKDSQSIINEIVQGRIIFDKKKEKFIYSKDKNTEYNIKNTAAGVKTIGILQTLLNNGLDSSSFIIMDEPEVHLHPSWQIKLAQVIVLLSKNENINFYINSHSPQFIEAIEVYTEKYEMEDETNFYYTLKEDNSDKFDFIGVNRENLSLLYRNLSESYNIIDEVRGENFDKKF